MFAKTIVSLIIFVGLGAAWTGLEASDPESKGNVTLMGTLAEWMYPDASFGGAQMSDGGNRRIQSVKCQAILTSDDSVEKVAKYYSEKYVSGPQDAQVADKSVDAKSVSTQEDSAGRPVQVRVIVVNRDKSSTTLVISRATGETETHIAWSHYLRLDGKR